MRQTFFTKSNVQLLAMSFVGIAIMVVMSLYVGASLKAGSRDPAALDVDQEIERDAANS